MLWNVKTPSPVTREGVKGGKEGKERRRLPLGKGKL